MQDSLSYAVKNNLSENWDKSIQSSDYTQHTLDTYKTTATALRNTSCSSCSSFLKQNHNSLTHHLLLLGQSSDTGERLTLEQLERGSSTGGNVGQLVLGAVLLGDSGGISTTNDDGSSVVDSLDTSVKNGLGTLGEVVKLKDTGGSVPENGLGLANDLLKLLNGLGTAVQTLPSVGDTVRVGSVANLGVLGELVGGDVVGGEDQLDVVLLGLLDETGDNLGSVLVKQRVSNLDVLEGLLEGESHTASDDEGVDLVEQVVDQLDLVGDLGTSKDGKEGSLGVLQSLGEELELLGNKETGGSLGELDTDHGRVGSVGGSKGVVDVDVGQRRQRLSELLDLGGVCLDLLAVGVLGGSLLLGVEPQVLQQDHLAVLCLGDLLLDLGADTVIEESDGLAEQLGELGLDGLERVLLDLLAVGSAEMGGQDHGLGSLIKSILDGGESGDDSLVVGDGGTVQRNVEVDSDEDSLVLEIEVLDGEFVGERHSGLAETR